MAHPCIAKMNKLLEPHNTQLLPIFSFGSDIPQKIALAVSKLNEKKRGRPVYMFAKYCPMCGKLLENS